jgi:hypothetical protein
MFVAGGVDLVLAGHDHHYDRSTLQPARAPGGHQVQYVTAGASARLRRRVVDDSNTFVAKADATIHSFLIAHVTSDAIRIEAIGADGRTLDTFEVVKRPWPDSEPGGRNESPKRATTPAMTQSADRRRPKPCHTSPTS